MLSSLIDTSKQDRFTLFIQTVYKWENIKSIFVWHFYFFHHNQNVIHWQWQCQQGMQKNYNILKCKQIERMKRNIIHFKKLNWQGLSINNIFPNHYAFQYTSQNIKCIIMSIGIIMVYWNCIINIELFD